MTIATDERIAKLQLYRTNGIGAITFKKLINHFGSAISALENIQSITSRHGKTIKPALLSSIQDEVHTAEKLGIQIIVQSDNEFPKHLIHTDGMPPILFVKGHSHLLNKTCISIVGARNCSNMSGHFAMRMAKALGEQGITIVSGLARGIDTYAHQGSIATGTIAVMASGVDICYPKDNQALYDSITEQGCLISEMAIGTPPNARLFPVRNRIVAGLSLGTAVVEAELKSGSLITARLAIEMGRDVFAVPGSPWDSRSKGCNKLIKDGATPLEVPDDILNTINLFSDTTLNSVDTNPFDTDYNIPVISDIDAQSIAQDILNILISSPRDVNSIIRESNHSPAIIKGILLEMELAEKVIYDNTGLCSLCARA